MNFGKFGAPWMFGKGALPFGKLGAGKLPFAGKFPFTGKYGKFGKFPFWGI